MRTTLDLPQDLLQQAVKLSKEKTKTGTIVMALREYIRSKKLEKLAHASGSVKMEPNYDWAKVRHGR